MGDSILYDFDSGTPAKDGATIKDEVLKIGNEIKIKTNAVLHFISDSAGAYVKARRLLKSEVDSPFMFIGPCLAHQTNLILKVRSCTTSVDDIVFIHVGFYKK